MTGEQYAPNSTSTQGGSPALAVYDRGGPSEVDSARQLNDASSVVHREAEAHFSACSSSDTPSGSGGPVTRMGASFIQSTSYDAHAADYAAETAETKHTGDLDDSRFNTIQEDSKHQLCSLPGGESGALSRLASLATQSVQLDTNGVEIPLRCHAAAQSNPMGDTELVNRLLEEDGDQRTHSAPLCAQGSGDGGEGSNGAGDTATGEESKGERNIHPQEQGTGANTGKERAVSSSDTTDPPSVASADSRLQLYLKPLINVRRSIYWQVRGDGQSYSGALQTIENVASDRANSIFNPQSKTDLSARSKPFPISRKYVFQILNQGRRLAKQRLNERPRTALDDDWYHQVEELTEELARSLAQDSDLLKVMGSQEFSVSPWYTQAAPADIDTPKRNASIKWDIQDVLPGSCTTKI